MKLIFLDFDGVIVHLPKNYKSIPISSLTEEDHFKRVRCANEESIAALNKIILGVEPYVYVIITSSWRHHHTLEMMTNMLYRSGHVGHVISRTPDLHRDEKSIERGHEIMAWMHMAEGLSKIDSYVVLDDDSDRGPIDESRWLLIKEGWTNGGLAGDPSYVQRAIKILETKL